MPPPPSLRRSRPAFRVTGATPSGRPGPRATNSHKRQAGAAPFKKDRWAAWRAPVVAVPRHAGQRSSLKGAAPAGRLWLFVARGPGRPEGVAPVTRNAGLLRLRDGGGGIPRAGYRDFSLPACVRSPDKPRGLSEVARFGPRARRARMVARPGVRTSGHAPRSISTNRGSGDNGVIAPWPAGSVVAAGFTAAPPAAGWLAWLWAEPSRRVQGHGARGAPARRWRWHRSQRLRGIISAGEQKPGSVCKWAMDRARSGSI